MIRKILFLAAFLIIAPVAEAQCRNGRCAPSSYSVRYYPAPAVAYYYPVVLTQQAVPVAAGDAYGFGGWLNAVRAQHGLRPMGYDASLAQCAAVNSSRGFGHSYMGNARRQNVGMGAAASTWGLWNNPRDPAHQSALLDPSCSFYGIAYVGGVWTFNAR